MHQGEPSHGPTPNAAGEKLEPRACLERAPQQEGESQGHGLGGASCWHSAVVGKVLSCNALNESKLDDCLPDYTQLNLKLFFLFIPVLIL